MAKISNHLFLCVAVACWSQLLLFSPLLFVFCCWLTAFSHPRYSLNLRTPLILCVCLLLSCPKYIKMFQHQWEFAFSVVSSPVYTNYFPHFCSTSSSAWEHRGTKRCLSQGEGCGFSLKSYHWNWCSSPISILTEEESHFQRKTFFLPTKTEST